MYIEYSDDFLSSTIFYESKCDTLRINMIDDVDLHKIIVIGKF